MTIIFLDTETTGLALDADIWEFAAIRREHDGNERTLHLFIEHDPNKAAALPESFQADLARRYHRPRPVARCWRCDGGPVTITRHGIGAQPCPLCGRTLAGRKTVRVADLLGEAS